MTTKPETPAEQASKWLKHGLPRPDDREMRRLAADELERALATLAAAQGAWTEYLTTGAFDGSESAAESKVTRALYDYSSYVTELKRVTKERDALREKLEHYRWIPVSERLPDRNAFFDVTIVLKDGSRDFRHALWNKGQWTPQGVVWWREEMNVPYEGEV